MQGGGAGDAGGVCTYASVCMDADASGESEATLVVSLLRCLCHHRAVCVTTLLAARRVVGAGVGQWT